MNITESYGYVRSSRKPKQEYKRFYKGIIMSIFSGWFKQTQSDIEKGLVEVYSQMYSQFAGITLKDSRNEVIKLIAIFKEEAIKNGTANLPDNYGDLLLRVAESGNLNAEKCIVKAHKEGATDEDIREFWNLSIIERRLVFWSEDIFRLASFKRFKDEGLDPEMASAKIRKMFPMYGDPDNEKHVFSDDRLLPQELRGRVDKYRKKYGATYIAEKVTKYNTYNAYVREEIRNGNL
ncbi:MAG: hypothetical protein Q8S54_08810 [Bacteroidota bacterium]|nr:hypothetical protein [Bacteroidota bacterium]